MGANSVGVNAPWSETSIIPSNARPQYTREHWKRRFQSEKSIKHFSSTLWWRNLKTKQSPAFLDLCSRKTQSEKSCDYRGSIIFEKFCFQNAFHSQQNENLVVSGLKSVFLISVDNRPNRRNKALFSNSSSVFWWRPSLLLSVHFGCCSCHTNLSSFAIFQLFLASFPFLSYILTV